MGVLTHYNNFIIRIDRIENCGYKGGFRKFINQFSEDIGEYVFFDKYIVNFIDLPNAYFGNHTVVRDFCDKYGLIDIEDREDGKYWKDYALISFFDATNGNYAKCDWLERDGKFIRLKGTSKHLNYPLCGRASYYRSFKYKNRYDYYANGFI